jgi:hypothetical protein
MITVFHNDDHSLGIAEMFGEILVCNRLGTIKRRLEIVVSCVIGIPNDLLGCAEAIDS